ncbi:MAG: glutamate--tRNA ligase [Planctomycetota bacterium]
MPEKVVTRFAPSPTGYLHVGGARTALFNWLFARKTGGTFILRIEDTDLKRNTPTAMKQVIKDLRWLGIEWDYGPEAGGPGGPYLQSQRRDIYDEYLKKLLDRGKAYYCFETPEELDQMRKQAGEKKQGFTYSRPESFPTEKEAQKARNDGKSVVVRFAMPKESTTVKDIILGEVTFDGGELGDFIIRKSDGFPTYHFACVVDDELMGVTHVIRGQEHLMNTPCHQALQDALGFRRPLYAHMAVTVSESGGKLSKREQPRALQKAIKTGSDIDKTALATAGGISAEQLESFLKGETMPDMPAVHAMAKHIGLHLPEINVSDFFKSGYLPETMVNFLALLGWNPGDDREVMKTEELIRAFDINRLTKTNSLFDRKKLLSFNTEHIKMLDPGKLLKHFKDYLGEVQSPLYGADDCTLARLLDICRGARTLQEVEKKNLFLFVKNDSIEYDEQAVNKVLLKNDGQGLKMLKIVRDRLAALEPITRETLEEMLRSLAEEEQAGLGKVAQPLRIAITGSTISPPIFDSVELLGIEKTLARVDAVLQKFQSTSQQGG